jgi:membrane protein DedA with SNARE-associated domain
MESRFLEWLAHYGPGVLFLAQMFGIFGLPIPDEFLMTVAGALAREGRLDPGITLLAAISGAFCGITMSYVLGRTVGTAALHRFVYVRDADFARAQRWFARFGGWLLVFGYFVPGVRHCTAMAAGSAPFPFRRFALYAYPGAVLWCLVFLSFGYYAGPHWRAAWHAFEHIGLYLLVPLAIVVVLAIYVTWRRTRTT